MQYKRVFIYAPDLPHIAELVILLAEEIPGVSIMTCVTREEALSVLSKSVPFDLVMVSARMWEPELLSKVKKGDTFPPLVFLLKKKESYPEHIFFAFRYCLNAPFSEKQVRWLVKELHEPDLLCLANWDFLLLKIDHRYVKLPFSMIKRIERKGKLVLITISSGKVYETFTSLSRLMELLPSEEFVLLERGVVVSLQSTRIVDDNVSLRDEYFLSRTKWKRSAGILSHELSLLMSVCSKVVVAMALLMFIGFRCKQVEHVAGDSRNVPGNYIVRLSYVAYDAEKSKLMQSLTSGCTPSVIVHIDEPDMGARMMQPVHTWQISYEHITRKQVETIIRALQLCKGVTDVVVSDE